MRTLFFSLLFLGKMLFAQQNGCFVEKITISSTWYNNVYTYTWQGNYNNSWTGTDGSYGSAEYNTSYQLLKMSTTSGGYTTTSTYSYNSYGKLKTIVTTNWLGTTTTTYSWSNTKNNNWTSTDGSYGSNTYNSDGYLTYTSTTSNGYTTSSTYTYNGSNQLTKTEMTTYTGTVTTTYTWNGNNNTWTNTNGDYGANTYDQYNNLTDYTYVTSGYTLSGSYEYDCSTIVSISNALMEEDILIFPNPAHEKIFISNLDNAESIIEIIDLNGQIIKSFPNSTSNIDVSDMNSGIYLVKIIKGNASKFSKLIIE